MQRWTFGRYCVQSVRMRERVMIVKRTYPRSRRVIIRWNFLETILSGDSLIFMMHACSTDQQQRLIEHFIRAPIRLALGNLMVDSPYFPHRNVSDRSENLDLGESWHVPNNQHNYKYIYIKFYTRYFLTSTSQKREQCNGNKLNLHTIFHTTLHRFSNTISYSTKLNLLQSKIECSRQKRRRLDMQYQRSVSSWMILPKVCRYLHSKK